MDMTLRTIVSFFLNAICEKISFSVNLESFKWTSSLVRCSNEGNSWSNARHFSRPPTSRGKEKNKIMISFFFFFFYISYTSKNLKIFRKIYFRSFLINPKLFNNKILNMKIIIFSNYYCNNFELFVKFEIHTKDIT